MSSTNNHRSNIQVYRKKWNFNIGVIIFGVIFIYLVVTVLMYLTKTHVTPYEVREGSILKDNAYTGFIIRDEKVINSDKSGYINFFALEGSKVGAKTCIYTLSDSKLDLESTTSSDAKTLSSEEQQAVYMKIQSYVDGFEERKFSDVYNLKDNVSSTLLNQDSQEKQKQLTSLSSDNKSGVQLCYAASDGVILYSIDGYEDVTTDTVTEAMISKDGYKSTTIQDNTKITAGTPIYKVVSDNDWKIAILVSDDTAKELKEENSVKVQFPENDEVIWAEVSLKKSGNTNIAILSFDNSMVSFDTSRYTDLELITTDESGLKIPKSSVTKKDFYVVPVDYLTQGGNSNSTGVLIDKGKDNAEFQNVTVFYVDEKNQLAYLDPDVFGKNTILRKEDSSDTYTLGETKSLKGVYNINKGYAEFKKVKILCESDEYYIIEPDSVYGLTNYDRIALNGADVREDDVVF